MPFPQCRARPVGVRSNEAHPGRAVLAGLLFALGAAVHAGAVDADGASGTAAPSAAAPHPAQVLIDAGWDAERNDPEEGRRDAEAALALLARAPDTDLTIRARLLLCDYHNERDLAAAQAQADAAAALLPRAHAAGLRSGVLNCRGAIREAAGANRDAMQLYQQAVDVASAAGDDRMLADALYSRGYLRGVAGDYAEGLDDERRAQQLYEKAGLPNHALTALTSVAMLYSRMGDTEQAGRLYEDALRVQHQAGMRREEVVTRHNLGRIYEKLQDWSRAGSAFQATLDLSRELGYVRGEAYGLRGVAAVANARGEPERALAMLAHADALLPRIPDARLAAQVDLVRGRALRLLGRLPAALAALQKAHDVFQAADSEEELSQVNAELARVQAAMGEWHAAYESEVAHDSAEQDRLRRQLDQRFAMLKMEFDTASTDRENAALTRQNQAAARALEQARRVRTLQGVVIGLAVTLVVVLAWIVVLQRARTRDMHVLAMTDELTDVPNRRAVLGRLQRQLQSGAAPCCVLIMDIDFFKRINDQHGHSTGDEVLKCVAGCVRAAVTEPAFLGRLGGEEFLLCLPRSDLAAGQRFAEALRERIMCLDLGVLGGGLTGTTVSLGVTDCMAATDTVSAMLRRADAALYAAKRAGRNCVRAEAAPEGARTVTRLARRTDVGHGSRS